MKVYILHPIIDATGVAIVMLFLAIPRLRDSHHAEIYSAEKETCLQKFEAIGMTKQDVFAVSDRKVLEVCGNMPKYQLNSAWHLDRKTPGRWTELHNCYAAFEAEGLTEEDARNASDNQLVELCETVPSAINLVRQ